MFLKRTKENDEASLEELRLIANSHGLTLFSDSWIGWDKYYTFSFPDGVQIKANACTVKYKGKKGFPRHPNYHIHKLRDIALANGGDLVSTKWMGNTVPHEFIDSHGNKFFCKPCFIKKGQ